jgi:hypothetical protein
MEDNPYRAPLEPNRAPSSDSQFDPDIEEAAKRLLKERQDTTTSWQLLATGVIGCFAPILAIYGLVFLLRRPQPFPLKGLAIAGTVLHFIWTVLMVVLFLVQRH